MTAAGIALIAGGIATLICFRAVLFRTGKRRAGRAERAGRPVEPARPAKVGRLPKAERLAKAERPAKPGRVARRAAEAQRRDVGLPVGAEIAGLVPAGRRDLDLGEAPVGAGAGFVAEELSEAGDDYPLGGLASLGLADHEDYEDEISADVFAEAEAELEMGAELELSPAPVGAFEGIHQAAELEDEMSEFTAVGGFPAVAEFSGAEFNAPATTGTEFAGPSGFAEPEFVGPEFVGPEFVGPGPGLGGAGGFERAGAYDRIGDPAFDQPDELELIDEQDEQAGLDELARIAAAEEPAGTDRYGHRVDGWVRPEYRDFPDEPPAGEYWTPIPVDLVRDHEPSAKGYGWPLPVERLPAVPSYEPATGFDLEPVRSEPTEAIGGWPRRSEERRIRLPRSWDDRNETQHFSAVQNEAPPRRRPRPRPRPEPPADRNTTVYVSRHAAEPPR
jgi:hypothetical protein